jgi:hypothetical protein
MNVRAAIENYLSAISSSDGVESERIQRLILSLDELALLSNNVLFDFDERDYSEPPEEGHRASKENIAKLFPSLGHYNIALDISDDVGQTSLAVGDAIDDIADIARDLKEIIWRFEKTSNADALFHFQLLFRSHWGMHLRSLQLYLHDLSRS